MTKPKGGLNISFYATPPYQCSYLPEKQAVTLFVDPSLPKSQGVYASLSGYGFRRSGEHLYRPRCPRCSDCIPVRIPVDDFQARRNQRRTWEKNQDLVVRPVEAGFDEEHFALYQRYVEIRHADGGMDQPTPQSYVDFLTATWTQTQFFEMRQSGKLVAVAVVDRMHDALSAVYTFYDPDLPQRSLGRYAILFEIEETRRQGLKWLYLGYWIRRCQKMSYKDEYQPLEYYFDGHWTRQWRKTGDKTPS
jgi:arginyl-tRNA--protein-N-Asp/Glu arginylyltransferase